MDFQTAYLAGYLADKYDVDADASISRANERIKNSTAEAFRSTVTGYSDHERFIEVRASSRVDTQYRLERQKVHIRHERSDGKAGR